jgi:L-cysteate sulfo-lyase
MKKLRIKGPLSQSRFPIAFLPTPIHALPDLTDHLGGAKLWIKRDDQTGLAFGGNKVRKLEYFTADAIAQDADTLITTGAPQSNHARQTAAAAAYAGMKCVLALRGTPPVQINGNVLLDQLLGADIVWMGERKGKVVMEQVAEDLRAKGRRPYIIPFGGSNAIGATAYVVAMQEYLDQMSEAGLSFDAIVFSTSSGGTQVGLVVGARHFGYKGRIIGISITYPADELKSSLVSIANETAIRLGLPLSFKVDDFEINDDYLGDGYAVMGEREREAIRLMAQTEGVFVDPVYTGRAMAGLIDLIRIGKLRRGQNVLFWHTGGTPALFAYASQLVAE